MIIYLLYMSFCVLLIFRFFFNDTATTEIYTLSLHDALPILVGEEIGERDDVDPRRRHVRPDAIEQQADERELDLRPDRKSTRLNSSHANISYAVFCLKKKKKLNMTISNTKDKRELHR